MDHSYERLIDEEIQQLQELKKMAANPRMVEVMRQIALQRNGSGKKSRPSRKRATAAKPESVETARNGRNGLFQAVRNAIRKFEGQFSTQDIENALVRARFRFVAKNRRVAVSSALAALASREEVRLVEKGIGGKPNVYEYSGE